MAYQGMAGVCKEGGCMMDAESSGYCRAHRKHDCENCGEPHYMHHEVMDKEHQVIVLCPTSVFK